MDKIDKGCMPTYGKYVKEQLIGAIVKYAKDGDISSFSNDFNSRKYIEEVGVLGFRQALLEHVVKLLKSGCERNGMVIKTDFYGDESAFFCGSLCKQ